MPNIESVTHYPGDGCDPDVLIVHCANCHDDMPFSEWQETRHLHCSMDANCDHQMEVHPLDPDFDRRRLCFGIPSRCRDVHETGLFVGCILRAACRPPKRDCGRPASYQSG